jgi:hypothetical protein
VSSAASDDSTVAIAFFGPGARDRERPVCVTARAGPCVRLECPGPYVASEDAGRIDVLGDGILVTSMSDPTHYTTVTLAPLGLGSGQRVTVTATGGAVPPFSASTTVPATTMSFSVPMSLDHGADLVVTWEPSTGPLIVSAGQLRNPVTVSCDVDAASGTVTIAASLLDAFSAGTLDVALAPWTRATVAAGDYTIDLYAFRTDLGYTVLR